MYNQALGIIKCIAKTKQMYTLTDIGADANRTCEATCLASSPSPPPIVLYNKRLNSNDATKAQSRECRVANLGPVAVAIQNSVSSDDDDDGDDDVLPPRDDFLLENIVGNIKERGTAIAKPTAQETSRGQRLAEGSKDPLVPFTEAILPCVCSLVIDVRFPPCGSKFGLMLLEEESSPSSLLVLPSSGIGTGRDIPASRDDDDVVNDCGLGASGEPGIAGIVRKSSPNSSGPINFFLDGTGVSAMS